MKRCFILIALIVISIQVSAQTDTVINAYAAVIGNNSNACNLVDLTVDNATGFSIGNEVLIIQMKGAAFDSSNTANFGNITNWNSVGHYEINTISNITGNVISLAFRMTRTYEYATGKVQLVRISHVSNYTINKVHTATAWTGTKGGIFAIRVDNRLTLNNDIDVSGKGFKGGTTPQPLYHTQYIKNMTNYFYPNNALNCAMKGEGIVEISNSKLFARGPLYNGGGGGNSTNAGGGGGGNGGIGGRGGDEWIGSSPPLSTGGIGGKIFAYTPANNKLFLGGGGGAGHANDAYIAPGGNGGGLVFIIADTIVGNNKNIYSDGENGMHCDPAVRGGTCNDGFGGGGAGGTIFLYAKAASQVNTYARGGHGANIISPFSMGPGGGAGGGAVIASTNTVLSSLTNNLSGGDGGVLTQTTNNTNGNWGTQPGTSGITATGLVPVIDTVTSVTNVINVNITDSAMQCREFQFRANSGSTLSSILWTFGDGNNGTGNPTNHTYTSTGPYTITLMLNDSLGCPHTFTHQVNVVPSNIVADVKIDTIGCKQYILTATSGSSLSSFAWDFGDGNTGTGNPVLHKYSQSGSFTITYSFVDSINCTHNLTKTINIKDIAVAVDIRSEIIKCRQVKLTATSLTPLTTTNWSFGDGTSGTGDSISHDYKSGGKFTVELTVTDSMGCIHPFTYITDDVGSTIPVNASNDTTICTESRIQIVASGAQDYIWTPSEGIENHRIGGPFVQPRKEITYTVLGTDDNGCTGKDSVQISILPEYSLKVSSDYPNINCKRSSVQLSVSGAVSYSWAPAEFFNDPTSPNPTVYPTAATKYVVTGLDERGCTGYGTIDIGYNKEANIFAPSAFTPNNDNRNEIFKIFPICNFTLKQLSIYNRWGQLVFTSSDVNEGWNGRFKSERPQDVGVYYYYAVGTDESGKTVHLKGDFTLIR